MLVCFALYPWANDWCAQSERGSRALKSLKLNTFWATSLLWLKASVLLIFCPNNFISHFALLCINFDGCLLRMSSLFWPLSWNWFLINIDGRCCLVCSTGLVMINMVINLCSMFLYVNFNYKTTFDMLIGTWRTTQENSTTTRTKRALVLAE
jgi:hypothetical protein